MTKKFTPKEISILKKNPYTLSVSENTIKFTIEFKEEFWRRYQCGELPRHIISALGYDLKIIGESRLVGIYQHVKKEALSPGGFRDYKKRHDPKNSTEILSELPSDQALSRMQHELLYMRQELDFIKKIIKTDNSDDQQL